VLRAKLQDLSVEEIANTLTHGFGLVLSIVGFAVLVTIAGLGGDPFVIAGSVLYGLSLVTLYAASTTYHASTSPNRKRILQVVDHCCIYLLIAGSYTPFALVVLRGSVGYALLATVWALAVLGIAIKIIFRGRFKAAGIALYLMMGWLGIIVIQPVYLALGILALALVVAGGVSYTLGMIFFGWHKLRHHHAIFHVFVLIGSILHYAAIAVYVVPWA
jgi:hemolysin III